MTKRGLHPHREEWPALRNKNTSTSFANNLLVRKKSLRAVAGAHPAGTSHYPKLEKQKLAVEGEGLGFRPRTFPSLGFPSHKTQENSTRNCFLKKCRWFSKIQTAAITCLKWCLLYSVIPCWNWKLSYKQRRKCEPVVELVGRLLSINSRFCCDGGGYIFITFSDHQGLFSPHLFSSVVSCYLSFLPTFWSCSPAPVSYFSLFCSNLHLCVWAQINCLSAEFQRQMANPFCWVGVSFCASLRETEDGRQGGLPARQFALF